MPFEVIDDQKDDRKFRSMAGVFKEIEAIETSYVSSPFDRAEGGADPRRAEVKVEAEKVRVQTSLKFKEEGQGNKAGPAPSAAVGEPPRAAPRDDRAIILERPWLANAEAETVDGPLSDQARARRRLIRTVVGLSVSVAFLLAVFATYRVARRSRSSVIAAPVATVAAEARPVSNGPASQVPAPPTAPPSSVRVTPTAAPLSTGRAPRAQQGPSTGAPLPAAPSAESSTPMPLAPAPVSPAPTAPSVSPAPTATTSAPNAAPPGADSDYALKPKITR